MLTTLLAVTFPLGIASALWNRLQNGRVQQMEGEVSHTVLELVSALRYPDSDSGSPRDAITAYVQGRSEKCPRVTPFAKQLTTGLDILVRHHADQHAERLSKSTCSFTSSESNVHVKLLTAVDDALHAFGPWPAANIFDPQTKILASVLRAVHNPERSWEDKERNLPPPIRRLMVGAARYLAAAAGAAPAPALVALAGPAAADPAASASVPVLAAPLLHPSQHILLIDLLGPKALLCLK